MGEVTRYPNGTFCWIDLGTPDPAQAKNFYGALFGWEFEDLPGENVRCRLGGQDVAGMHVDPAPAWISAVSVDDVDSTVERAVRIGGVAEAEAQDAGEGSRFAVIRDPAGARLMLWHSTTFPGARWVNEVDTWSWNELLTTDLDATAAFYTELFDWTPLEGPPLDVAASGRRLLFHRGELMISGAHESDQQQWTVRFRVADCDATAGRIEQLGGRVQVPPTPVPLGAYGEATDPQGAPFTFIAAPAGGVQGLDVVPVP